MINQPLSLDGVRPPNKLVPEIDSPLPCLSGLIRHILLFLYLFQRTDFFHWLSPSRTGIKFAGYRPAVVKPHQWTRLFAVGGDS